MKKNRNHDNGRRNEEGWLARMSCPDGRSALEALMTSGLGYLDSVSLRNKDVDSSRTAGITGIGRPDKSVDRRVRWGATVAAFELGGAAESGVNFRGELLGEI